MIMEGLETLVAPTHHAFLLTETAAAAHFNVLSFDTCLFKTSTAAQSSGSPSSAAAATYLSPAQFGGNPSGAGPSSGSLNSTSASASSSSSSLLHYTNASAAAAAAAAAAASAAAANNNSVLRARNQTATPTQGGSPGHVAVQPSAAASSGRSSASHLSLLNTSGQHSPHSASASVVEQVEVHKQMIEALPGDLNTPVTTSSDIPSFFGPTTVVEPPPITGE